MARKSSERFSGRFVAVRNLSRYQHYRDRNPPWVKLHQLLLDDYEFAALPDASKAHALALLLLASRMDNRMPADPDWIGRRINANTKVDLDALVSCGFLGICEDASAALATCPKDSITLLKPGAPEGEGEGETEKRREKTLVGPGAGPTSPEPDPRTTAEAELRWRVEVVWSDHLTQHNAFWREVSGRPAVSTPTLTSDIRKDIRACLLEYDELWLTPETREDWRAKSKTRAAGIGIYLDPWDTGEHKDNDVRNGGKRYLDHWRPWRHQRGKGRPVERFAELYFQSKRAA